ncbi:hypothetical protein [Ralstonia mojiangensis]|uniref:hypothetical protein n=1 Tax=Ralstonia mojiangensis TaxID=2953895 RepID=UPI0021B434E1|nr:hypothetical protein [Ralstonia mojiangensis]MCT7328829.1 hypothetical protein [Ralstonia mojiangensis]
MHSRDKRAQLKALHGLGQMRVRGALNDLQRARAHVRALKQQLEDTQHRIAQLDRERESLFEKHRGFTDRNGLFSLRRRASMLDIQRVDLSLSRVQLRSNIEVAVQEASIAQSAVARAHRERDKLEHVSRLWHREETISMHLQEEIDSSAGIPV